MIEQDSDSTIAIYGHDVGFRKVLIGDVKSPAAAAPFMSALSMAGHQAAAHEAKENDRTRNRSTQCGSDTPVRRR